MPVGALPGWIDAFECDSAVGVFVMKRHGGRSERRWRFRARKKAES